MRISDWRRQVRRIEMSHGLTTYVDIGEGPPCLLLHGVGFTQGAHDWLLNAGVLARDFRVVAADFVGWGAGSRLRQPYSFDRLVDFVRELQDVLGIERSHIVGHSMGGWIASLLAYESPQRVDRLVLVGSGGAATRPLPMMTTFTPPTREQAGELLRGRTRVDDDLVREWADYGWENVQGADSVPAYRSLLAHMTDPENRRLHDMHRRFPFIRRPTLVLWGREDDVNAVDLGRLTADSVPGAVLVELDAGHFLPSELPAEFNRSVGDFLAGRSVTL